MHIITIVDTERRIMMPKIEDSGMDPEIYHSHNGVDGYRNMAVYLACRGYGYGSTALHKYMDTGLGLRPIVCLEKIGYQYGKAHKVFENGMNQDFIARRISPKWCTSFMYLFLDSHEVGYNCTIIGLHDRSIIASITGHDITSAPTVRVLQKALTLQLLVITMSVRIVLTDIGHIIRHGLYFGIMAAAIALALSSGLR